MSDASVVADNGVDWELLPHNWWRESFNAVSWTYPPPHRVRRRSSALSPSIALSSPSSSQFKPLPLRDTLSRSSPNALELSVCCERCQELRHRLCPCSSGGIGPSADLKSSLVGVGIAEDAVEAYEASAGFGERTMDEPDVTELTRRVMALQRHTGTDGLVEHRDAWRSQLHDVFPDAKFTCSTGLALPPSDDAAHLAPMLDLDLKSITEIEPHPSTPRPTPRVATSIKEQVDQVLRKFERLHGDWQDEDAKVTPREPPSPSTASSSPATSDDLQSLVSFGTSRTRSSSLPSVNLRKDEHGFYNPVESDSDAAAPALFGAGSPRGRKPAFSKVRARAVARRHGKPQALNDGTDEDDARQTFTVSSLFQRSNDGWIRFVDDDTDKPMVALRPPQTPSDDADIDEPWPSLTPAPGIASAPKPKPPQPKHARRASASAEGWIEPSPVASFSGQRKQRSRSQQFAPPANRGQYGFPPPPPPPPPPPAPVMQPGYFMYAPMQPAPQTFMPVPYSYAPYGMAPPQIIPYGQFGMGAPTMYRANGWL